MKIFEENISVVHITQRSILPQVTLIRNKNKLRPFKSSEHINEKGDGPYAVSATLFSDPIDLATWSQRELL